MRIRSALLAIVLCAAGCSGNSVEGTVDGKTVGGSSAFVGHFFAYEGFTPTIVLMSSASNVCLAMKDNKEIKNSSGVFFILGVKTGADRTAAKETGTYVVSPSTSIPEGKFALVIAYNQGADCVDTLDASKSTGVSGTVTLEEYAEGGAAAGKFDVTFPGGGKLTGEFDAGACASVVPEGTATCE